LYHPPPNAESFHCRATDDYLFFPSRLTRVKRQELVLEALAQTRHPVVVRFSGAADEQGHLENLKALAKRLGVEKRAVWLGNISEEEKTRQYADTTGVLYPPRDEDFGYVSLEAMLSSKALITCTDSGGPLEFVRDGVNGYVTEPAAEALAAAMDRLWEDRGAAKALGEAGREHYANLRISWDHVVEQLIACA